MKKLLPLILILFAAPCFGESYLCIADNATGFKANNEWEPAFFIPNIKFIFRPPNEHEIIQKKVDINTKYVLTDFGNDILPIACKRYVYYKSNARELRTYECKKGDNGIENFVINLNTLRFYHLYTGHALGGNQNGDDFAIHLGKCSKV